MLYEKKSVSDHIQVQQISAGTDYLKGDLVKVGSLIGFSDYDTPRGTQGSIDVGVPRSVFQAKTSDLTGTAAVGNDIYVTSALALTTTASDNDLFGTIVAVGSDTFDFAVL